MRSTRSGTREEGAATWASLVRVAMLMLTMAMTSMATTLLMLMCAFALMRIMMQMTMVMLIMMVTVMALVVMVTAAMKFAQPRLGAKRQTARHGNDATRQQ